MFDALKKKLSGWFGKKEEKEKEKQKEKKVSASVEKKPKKNGKKAAKNDKKKMPEQIVLKSKKSTGDELTASADIKIIESADMPCLAVLEEEKSNAPEIEEVEAPLAEIKEEKEEGFFAKLKRKLTTSVLTQEQFDEIFAELEITLLESNVALEVVDAIRAGLSRDLVGISVKKDEIDATIHKSLREAISAVLSEPPDLFKEIEKSLEPYVILFFGINGTGKTTTIAKIASLLKARGISCVIAAADTFRAASIEQIQHHGEKLGIEVVAHKYGSDPAAVVYDALQHAKSRKVQVVLVDTAGRMYTKSNLLKEMEKIVRIGKPNLKIFVGEAIAGNDVVEQAKTFNESVGIDGIILSKADVDEKAGAVLSVGFVTGKPIYFLGVGQRYEDLRVFRKEEILKGLGLG